jgi:hypothetical protein
MRAPRRTSRAKTKSLTLGRRVFDKISAVEGLRLTTDMKDTFRVLDQSGASAAVRRRTIVKKYGKEIRP